MYFMYCEKATKGFSLSHFICRRPAADSRSILLTLSMAKCALLLAQHTYTRSTSTLSRTNYNRRAVWNSSKTLTASCEFVNDTLSIHMLSAKILHFCHSMFIFFLSIKTHLCLPGSHQLIPSNSSQSGPSYYQLILKLKGGNFSSFYKFSSLKVFEFLFLNYNLK